MQALLFCTPRPVGHHLGAMAIAGSIATATAVAAPLSPLGAPSSAP